MRIFYNNGDPHGWFYKDGCDSNMSARMLSDGNCGYLAANVHLAGNKDGRIQNPLLTIPKLGRPETSND